VPVSGTARVRRRVVLGAVATAMAGMLGGCARQEAPPGGPEDRRPPVVVRTVPEAFDTVSDLREVRFDFDERISERVAGGSLNEAVTVSPRGGDVRVSHSRRSLSVRVEGGFEEGLVYRVTLRPAVSDLFGNQLADPFELVFSTGGALVPTTLAGEVWDRITGSNTSDALVLASEGPDSPVHQSVTDREGIFALRYLPSGRVTVTAFEDVNRNGAIDSTEIQGATTAELVSGDTLIIDLPILAPDTAAAVALSADAIDSVTVVVEFDDYLEPSSELDGIDVALRREGAVAPAVVRRFHEADYRAFVEAVADSLARLDSIDRARATDREVSTGPDEPGTIPSEAREIVARGAGVTTVVATHREHRDSIPVRVRRVAGTLSFGSPTVVLLAVGRDTVVPLQVWDTNDSLIPAPSIRWTSSDPTAITVSAEGAVRALRAAPAVLTAQIDTVSATLNVSVHQTVANLEVSAGDLQTGPVGASVPVPPSVVASARKAARFPRRWPPVQRGLKEGPYPFGHRHRDA